MQISYSDDNCTIVIQKDIDPAECSIDEFLYEFLKPMFRAAGWAEEFVEALIVAENIDKKKTN